MMNRLLYRVTALAMTLVMLTGLCACSNTERLSEQTVTQAYESYSTGYDGLYQRLKASFPDLVSGSDFADGKADIDDAYAQCRPGEKVSQEQYLGYIGGIESAYNSASCALVAPVLCDISTRYSQYYQALFGQSDDAVSFSDAVGAEISSTQKLAKMKGLAKALGDRYYHYYKRELTPESTDELVVKAYLSKEKDSTIVLITNFDIPRIREQNSAFALDIYSSAKDVQLSVPDTLYNYEAISYTARNIAEIDMGKVISGCQFEDILKVYKRITFIVFAIDNSFTAELDLSNLGSDDYLTLPPLPDDALSSLLEAL